MSRLFCIFILINLACSISMSSEIKKQKNKTDMNKLFFTQKTLILENLEKTGSILSIKNYLTTDFTYVNDFEKGVPPGEFAMPIIYNDKLENLKKIDKKIVYSDVISVLKKGVPQIGSKLAYLMVSKQRKNNYPVIMFRYIKKAKEWRLLSIRYSKE